MFSPVQVGLLSVASGTASAPGSGIEGDGIIGGKPEGEAWREFSEMRLLRQYTCLTAFYQGWGARTFLVSLIALTPVSTTTLTPVLFPLALPPWWVGATKPPN